MTLNPFVSLWNDPVTTLAALAYAALLLALSVGFVGLLTQTLFRAWDDLVWLGNAFEFRHTDQRLGAEWEWYLPPKPVINRLSRFVGYFAATAFVGSLLLWAISGAVYVLGSL